MSNDPWDEPCTCPHVLDEAGNRLHLLACSLHHANRSIHDEEVQAMREATLPEWRRRSLPTYVRSDWS